MNGSYAKGSLVLVVGIFIILNHVFAQPVSYAVIDQGANYRVWSQTVPQNGSKVVHQYTELATGLNFTNASGQWQPSQEQITLLPTGGAAATNGQHQVYFPADIYNGVLEVITPDGRHLQSRPLGVSYDDGSNTFFIATLTNSIGQLVGSNQVVYPNAFVGFKADLVMTYRRSGFESDLVFRQQPPTPGQCGLDSSFTTLELVTEFFNTPDPQQIPAASDDWYGLQDSTLQFGALGMTQGKAFAMQATNSQPPSANAKTTVYKSWVHSAGRTFLIESVPLPDIAQDLGALPLTAGIANPKSSIRHLASSRRTFPPTHGLVTDTNQILLASSDFNRQPGVVLDYDMVNPSVTNMTFETGTTYDISGYVYLNGTTTFQPGAVLKYERYSNLHSYSVHGTLDWLATPSQPVVLTAVDDNSVGDIIPTSTGSPSGYYADEALHFAGQGLIISNVWVGYADIGLDLYEYGSGGDGVQLSDAEFHDCGTVAFGDHSSDNSYVNNVLFENMAQVCLELDGYEFDVQNATFNNAAYIVSYDESPIYLNLTNCILANVTQIAYSGSSPDGYYNGFYNSPIVGYNTFTNTFYPFETFGSADCYLTNGTTFRDAGTTSIAPGLLAELESKTTYAPPEGQHPDNDGMPDLGYHYAILGYITNGLVAYWRLNDGTGSTAVDSVAGNNVTLVGSPTWGSSYLNLNGSSQYGDAGSSLLSSIEQHDKTICVWVKPSAYPSSGNFQGIVDKYFYNSSSDYGGWALWWGVNISNTNKMYWTARYGAEDAGAQVIPLNNWSFLTAVWHYSMTRVDFYIDGQFVDSEVKNTDVELPSGSAHLTIGNAKSNSGGGANDFSGSIHDVGIYNRALSANEVMTNFLNTEFNANVPVPDLLYYKMTYAEAQQTNTDTIVLSDYSTSGNHTGYGQTSGGQLWQWTNNIVGATNALHFNGNNSVLTVTNSSVAFNFTFNPFTVNLWDSQEHSGNGILMQNGGNTNGWYVALGDYYVYFGSATPTSSSYITGGEAGNDVWKMITCVWDGTNASIYINGSQVAVSDSFSAPAPSTNNLVFGVDYTLVTNYLDGQIWLSQIWRVALSPTDIANLYFQQVKGIPWP